jgi:hypothetical protein
MSASKYPIADSTISLYNERKDRRRLDEFGHDK